MNRYGHITGPCGAEILSVNNRDTMLRHSSRILSPNLD